MTSDSTTTPALPDSTHPYAVRVSLMLGTNIELEMKEDELRLAFTDAHTIRIMKERRSPREEALFITPVLVDLEAFTSAVEAERAGKLLTLSLLWLAASKKATMRFTKWTGDYPFAIRDRTQSSGMSVRAEGRVHWNLKPQEFVAIASMAYNKGKDVHRSVLTSMEFYAAARMEATEQARFIFLVTALEALSVQSDYGEGIASVLAKLESQLRSDPAIAGEDRSALRESLAGRLRQLRHESVRQAIVRTVQQYVSDAGTVKFVDEAYGLRSKILHEGKRTLGLDSLTNRLEDVLRTIYAALLGLQLTTPLPPV